MTRSKHPDEPSALLGPAEIRDLAELLDVTPTKKLGQNFVHDPNTVRKIVRVGGVEPGDVVVEVGPGLGSLTLGLLEAGASVVAIEIDRRLAEQLPITVAQLADASRLTVIADDALRVVSLPEPASRLVANLPYNVSVPVLLHLLEHVPSIRSGVVMVQAEVGHRLAAEPGSKVYGGPSVKAAWYGRWRVAGQVSRQVFWPVPNVDSVLVGFERRSPEDELGDEVLRKRTFEIVDAAFGQRRKMLRQALIPVFGDSSRAAAGLAAAGLPETARGEQLDVDDFVSLARVEAGA
ncbi:16S rRNA (adenine(1518)-N(6)/adenine(1519)-N(6))-dimethyltransferase RsmA [Cnuibacter physcomitrellae]|uniref:16S rRNA (adenine(1518)-N(6)/adenine(1519)-N(6))- dimethyltransferase RsmA n=1 Tax=Cnuibacter physcomitrellae TaxID=1619308 RepID=UPI002175A9F4|nr:16S rRNA (adenine(1518)-N(6)/adenine(1519)-N(6))-dimethyltransferase RsmA [Cnuibacter physcomitrellae]MCS5499377.1 16S rRNA (adenine(1518)-N(6)/adenine(1519)-N(6))-dimethyltransferase RsmA [Cnuibacter physcomitrellae]